VAIAPNYLRAASQRPISSTYMGGFSAPKIAKVRAAFIGVGARGGTHAKFFAALEGTEVVAICDLYEDLVKEKTRWVKEAGGSNKHKNIAQYWDAARK